MNMKYNIFYNASGYPIDRMIKDKTDNNYIKVSKVWDIKLTFMYLISKLYPKVYKNNFYNRVMFTYKPIFSFQGIVHLFNTVYIGKMNWVCTIEYMFPAGYYKMPEELYKQYVIKLSKYLCRDNCIKLLPMSDFSKRRITSDFYSYLPKNKADEIVRKIFVLHPPQPVLISKDEIKEKFLSDQLYFCFVGRDFWRKGGYISFQALKNIRKKYSNFKFIIISSFKDDGGWYVTNKEELLQEIRESDFVEWHEELDNNKVIDVLKKCHVGLLPTYGDTYGFSVLEMQACGCPCITTGGFALPEINNNECGWLIEGLDIEEVKCNKEKNEYQQKLILKLTDLLEKEIFSNDNYIDNLNLKAINSLSRISKMHSPDKYKESMEKIYEEAKRAWNK